MTVPAKDINSPEFLAIQQCYTDLIRVLDLDPGDAEGKLIQARFFTPPKRNRDGSAMIDSVSSFVKDKAIKFYKFLGVLHKLRDTQDVLVELHQTFYRKHT